MDTLEPDRNVGDESDAGAKLRADLLLVDVISQAVGNYVVRKVLDVVLRAGFGASTRVAGNAEDSGLSTEVRDKRSDSNLSSSRIASRVGDTGSLGNLGTADQLRKTVSPLLIEAVVGTEINDHIAGLGTLVDSIDEGLADTVGESHNPAVNITVGRHALDIIGAEVLVDNLTLVIALQLLASQLTRRNMTQVQVRVSVDQVDQRLASVTASSNQSNLGRAGVGHVLVRASANHTRSRERSTWTESSHGVDTTGRLGQATANGATSRGSVEGTPGEACTTP